MSVTGADHRLNLLGDLDGHPERDLALELDLLDRASSGSVSLFLYSWASPVVVLGYGQRIEDIDLDWCRGAGVPVYRRMTGGTGVVHRRDLAVSLFLPAAHRWAGRITGLYGLFLRALVLGLEAAGGRGRLLTRDSQQLPAAGGDSPPIPAPPERVPAQRRSRLGVLNVPAHSGSSGVSTPSAWPPFGRSARSLGTPPRPSGRKSHRARAQSGLVFSQIGSLPRPLATKLGERRGLTGNLQEGGRDRSPICFEDQLSETLVVDGRKVVGCAQARRSRAVLIHAAVSLNLAVEVYAGAFGVSEGRIEEGLGEAVPGGRAGEVVPFVEKALAEALEISVEAEVLPEPSRESVQRYRSSHWAPLRGRQE